MNTYNKELTPSAVHVQLLHGDTVSDCPRGMFFACTEHDSPSVQSFKSKDGSVLHAIRGFLYCEGQDVRVSL